MLMTRKLISNSAVDDSLFESGPGWSFSCLPLSSSKYPHMVRRVWNCGELSDQEKKSSVIYKGEFGGRLLTFQNDSDIDTKPKNHDTW